MKHITVKAVISNLILATPHLSISKIMMTPEKYDSNYLNSLNSYYLTLVYSLKSLNRH